MYRYTSQTLSFRRVVQLQADQNLSVRRVIQALYKYKSDISQITTLKEGWLGKLNQLRQKSPYTIKVIGCLLNTLQLAFVVNYPCFFNTTQLPLMCLLIPYQFIRYVHQRLSRSRFTSHIATLDALFIKISYSQGILLMYGGIVISNLLFSLTFSVVLQKL